MSASRAGTGRATTRPSAGPCWTTWPNIFPRRRIPSGPSCSPTSRRGSSSSGTGSTGDRRLRQPPRTPRNGERLGQSPLRGVRDRGFAGPTCFGGWDANGDPIAVARWWPVVEIAAVSEDQTEHLGRALPRAQCQRAARREGARHRHRPDPNVPDRSEARDDASRHRRAPAGRAAHLRGPRQTHLWYPSNGGTKLAGTLRRNAAKMDGRTFETTNAP